MVAPIMGMMRASVPVPAPTPFLHLVILGGTRNDHGLDATDFLSGSTHAPGPTRGSDRRGISQRALTFSCL